MLIFESLTPPWIFKYVLTKRPIPKKNALVPPEYKVVFLIKTVKNNALIIPRITAINILYSNFFTFIKKLNFMIDDLYEKDFGNFVRLGTAIMII
jgi:hypothetical protein